MLTTTFPLECPVPNLNRVKRKDMNKVKHVNCINNQYVRYVLKSSYVPDFYAANY